jgi:hypothetical protein
MAVDEPRDILAELMDLAAEYRGSIPWRSNRTPSNPVKLRSRYTPTVVFAHTLPRIALSAREGAALLYALQAQRSGIMGGILFSRAFRHRDGRELVLEDGVLSDLLAVGVITHTPSPEQEEFVVTGLGQSEIARCFPGHVF